MGGTLHSYTGRQRGGGSLLDRFAPQRRYNDDRDHHPPNAWHRPPSSHRDRRRIQINKTHPSILQEEKITGPSSEVETLKHSNGVKHKALGVQLLEHRGAPPNLGAPLRTTTYESVTDLPVAVTPLPNEKVVFGLKRGPHTELFQQNLA